MSLLFWIASGVLALGLGLWIGGGARYDRDPREVDEAFDKGRPTRKANRHFTLLNAYFDRKAPPSARKRRQESSRVPFRR